MHRTIILLGALLFLVVGSGQAQQVVITNFPLGVGGSVNAEQFKPYRGQLQAIADTLKAYRLARAIVTGGADGVKYRRNHDALNPGLSVGRAHILRNLLISEYGVDSAQIVIQSDDTKIAGDDRRYASVRIDRTISDLDDRLTALEKRPPVERIITPVQPDMGEQVATQSGLEFIGLEFGVGGTSSPFGFIPLATGAVTWKRIVFVEALFGHTFWNEHFLFEGDNLTTKRRIIGTQAIVYPNWELPVGIVAGWARIEEISQYYYEYVQLSEGPMIGLRVTPIKHVSVTGVYNPSKYRVAGRDQSTARNDQFLLSAALHLSFGGAR